MRINDVRFIALGLLTLAGPAVAQFSPGPNPITVGTNTPQTLSGGTGTIEGSGGIQVSTGSTAPLSIFGTSSLFNAGTIRTFGLSSARAIDSNSGIANLFIDNSGFIISNRNDAFRVNTDSAVELINTGTITANNGQAIDWAAIRTARNVLDNRSTGGITTIGEDAVRPGVNGVVMNAGTITATPTVNLGVVTGSDGIDLRTLSGIQVSNSVTGTISGRHGIATDGSNVGPSTFTLTSNFGLIEGVNGSGLNIDGVSASVTANVTNDVGGIIRGGVLADADLGDGDGIDVDGVLTLVNRGSIFGRGARGGTNNAEGIAAGGGSITNAQNASIIGSTLLADSPTGETSRAGNGILIDDSNGGNAIAQTLVANDGLIQGKSGFAIKIVGSFNDSIANGAIGTIRGAGTGAAIQMGDGADLLSNSGTIISDIGNAIDMEGGNDSVIFRNGSVVTGDVSGGAGSNSLAFNDAAGGTIAYAGVLSNFDQVSINSGQVTLSGANQYTGTTLIGGAPGVDATLTLDGANRISAQSGLSLNVDARLELINTAGANAQTFGSLALQGDATFDLGFSSLTFNSLGLVADGSTLTVLDWSSTTSPDFAFRFLGDTGSDQMFLALISGTTINGLGAMFSFDGTYTNVSAVPLPGALLLFGSALGLFGSMRRRATGVYAVGHARRTPVGFAANS